MQQQISPAVIVVVVIVVILVLIAMWHFIYGQQAKMAPAEGDVVEPEPDAEGPSAEGTAPAEEDDEEQPSGEEAVETAPASTDE
ncbi:MAG: hypothetical protein ACE5JM_17450 [Armatimonadota bacterium]